MSNSVLSGFFNRFPTLLEEWNFSKNNVDPETLLYIDRKTRYWWINETCGHQWQATLSSRSVGSGCAVCAGKQVMVGFNDLWTTHPSIASQWHPSKNEDLSPFEFSKGSHKIVWWMCSKGHEFESQINRRNEKHCPVCSGKKILIGYNDLSTTHPKLAKEFHKTKNTIPLEEVSKGKEIDLWWQCIKGHEFETNLKYRVKDTGCPICMNKKLVVGQNDLASVHPTIAIFWHPTKNTKTPYEVFYSSGSAAWWLGSCEHEWEQKINVAVSGKFACPYCNGRRILVGFNDLNTTHPEIAQELHPTKNILSAQQMTAGSAIKVWWLCKKGHDFEMRIADKIFHQCSVCNGRTAFPGFNDLKSQFPQVAKEWHPTLNTVSASQVTFGSSAKAWWLCDKNHVWEATIGSRSYGAGCPSCRGQQSRSEKELFAFVLEFVADAVNNDRATIKPYELDIYIPSRKMAIEFNGIYWHSEANSKNKYYHYDKWKACKEKGIQLIQVWEDDRNRNPDLVKRMLAHKLGVSQELRVHGRKLIIREVTPDTTNEFLDEYHIQGSVDGSIRVGLFENITVIQPFQEKPVAVMVLKREPGTEGTTLNLLRYATAKNVVGGFTKLLKHVEKEFKPESIVTFSDNCVSDGGLYENNGFKAVRELKPDYMYVVRGERVHKFSYRLKRFREDPELVFEEGLSERELALLNNIPRIWDAGKVKWLRVVGG